MGVKKINNETKGKIITLLKLKWSLSMIVRELQKDEIFVTRSAIQKIKKQTLGSTYQQKQRNQKDKNRVYRCTHPSWKISKLKRLVSSPNPPTLRCLVKKLKMPLTTIWRIINKKLNMKLVKKRRVHTLSLDSKMKRAKRSWKLYLLLNNHKWEKYITTDEAWFYLSNCGGQRKVQYVSRGGGESARIPYYNKPSFAKGVMVWAGVSSKGKTKLYFVQPGAKINAQYYIQNILTPFISKDVKRLYPNGDFILHQDSAPSHAAKTTINFLMDKGIKFITPEQWTPMSPDASPMDYFVWGYLKQKLWSRKVNSLEGLKTALKQEWKKLPQDLINKAVNSWPKR